MLAVGALAGCAVAATALPVTAGAKTHPAALVCHGTTARPGVLAGTVDRSVVVRGTCDVDHGTATVHGSVTVAPKGVLNATFGLDDRTHTGVSDLTITGSLVVERGAVAMVGCEAAAFRCTDDDPNSPTLSDRISVDRNLVAIDALGVVAHRTSVRGSVTQVGGGGGITCAKSAPVFRVLRNPVFSDYEDDSIGGSLSISGLRSCWLGTLRDHVRHGFTLHDDRLADADAIEIGTNVIGGNLVCTDDTKVWDSNDIGANLYPRQFDPNGVRGRREGQCVRSTALTMGGPTGQHPF
ncbi:MAG: hypothetical protein ACRDMJ_17100 [Solirubrobacteraceae bacterium]